MEDHVESDWYSEDSATFGDRLAAAREACQLTQEDLSKRLGIKLGTLQSWENDRSEPRAQRLSMVSGILNVSLRWLMTGQSEGAPNEIPTEMSEVPGDVLSILVEMRDLQMQIAQSGERLGVLAKRLRRATEIQ